MAEIRLDALENPSPKDVDDILKIRPLPTIVTCRPADEGGQFDGKENCRIALLQQAVNAGSEYVDLEWSRWGQLTPSARTQFIASHHDFEKMPKTVSTLSAQMARAEHVSVIKIALYCDDLRDQLRLKDLIQQTSLPVVGIGMGPRGVASRSLATAWGSPWTYAAATPQDRTAPGLPSLQDPFRPADPKTRLFGLLGNPAIHSLGPAVHGAALEAVGLNGIYLPMEADSVEEGVEFATRAGFEGLSITMPFKREILPCAHFIDPLAQEVGAANTLHAGPEGWYASNTDASAIEHLLQTRLTSPRKGRCLVLGAGGAARAAIVAARRVGLEVLVSSRTSENARAAASSFNAHYLEWNDRNFPSDLRCVIHATPLGMDGFENQIPLDPSELSPDTLILETVYHPPRTRLLRESQKANLPTISGDEVFIAQAADQFRHFTKMSPPIDIMTSALAAERKRRDG
jgi:3-dehydroquinate dehydratase/shikimate dehydrogenase